MFARALKTNIIVSMAVLLILGMLLIDFVLVRTSQREMIQDKIAKGRLVLSLLQEPILISLAGSAPEHQRYLKAKLADILSQSDFSVVSLMDAGHRVVYSAGRKIESSKELEKMMKAASAAGESMVGFSGTTWGVIWYQRKHLMLAAPVRNGSTQVASVGILMNLETIFARQRHSQRFVIFYLALNTLILTFVGFFRLSKVYLEPINRLVRMAEGYQEADGTFFPVRKQDNELSKLSKALNMMINRISEDKTKLRSMVDSLEKTNLELQKAQGEIIRAEKLASIGRLSSGIAHEIGNPIGIVMGYLDLIKQENIPEHEKKEFTQRIEKEIHRMDTVIRQLLDLSRPHATATETISVHELIKDTMQVLRVQPLTSKIQISMDLDAADDRVKADANQLRQVFLNLAINAADAIASAEGGRPGELTIKTESVLDDSAGAGGRSPHLKLMFIDNGPGIPEAHLANIFDPFFTTKAPGKGTGLGLWVCFMIVDSIGGRISAASSAGRPTTVTIWLPLAA